MAPRKRAVAGAGAALRAALDGELGDGFSWDAREAKLIDTACELADRLAEVTAIIDRDGALLASATGVPKAHPLLSEQRQLSIALPKVLEGVRLPDESATSSGTVASLRHSRAARARWDRVKRAEGGA